MSSLRNIKAKVFNANSASYFLCALFFFVLGLLVRRVPVIKLDPALGIGELASILLTVLALIGAWIIIPSVIEKAVQQRNSKDNILVGDLSELCNLLHNLKHKYEKLHMDGTVLTDVIRGGILSDVRFIGNAISDLDTDIQREHPELKFDKNVKNLFNEVTYKVLTEDLPVHDPITKEMLLACSNALTILISVVKKYRFHTIDS